MIPSRQEILYRIFGALQLARLDAGGAQYFEESPRAALRSFFAAVLVAPAFLASLLLAYPRAPALDAPMIVLVMLISYSLLWTAYPLIAYRVCQAIDREQAFFRYLSALNWCSVIAYHFRLVVVVFMAGGLVPDALAPLVELAVQVCLLGYAWFVARSCLKISSLAAAGFVALDFIVGIFIQIIAVGILYPEGP